MMINSTTINELLKTGSGREQLSKMMDEAMYEIDQECMRLYGFKYSYNMSGLNREQAINIIVQGVNIFRGINGTKKDIKPYND